MIASSCPECGGEVLLPDPPPNTKEQNIEFRKRWDYRVWLGEFRDRWLAHVQQVWS